MNKKKPVFSVITVTYNDMDGIKNTCSSVRSQDFDAFEHIVIDGGSVDGTREYLSGLSYQAFKYISEEDEGIYDAMNKGINMSAGDYLIFLNSGDVFYDELVLKSVSRFIGGGYGLIYGDTVEKEIDGGLVYKKARDYNTYWYSMFGHHQSIFFSRILINDKRYNTKYVSSSDYAFLSELLKGKPSVKYIKIPVSIFLQGGLSSKLSKRYVICRDRWEIKRKIIGMNPVFVFLIISVQLLVYFMRLFSKDLYYRVRGMKKI